MSSTIADAIVMVAVVALVTIPSWRLGKRLAMPARLRTASPEEQAEWKRERAMRQKEPFAALTRRERILLYSYYAISLPAMPVGLSLTIYGSGTSRTVGVALLLAAIAMSAVPLGPILVARARRRQRAADES
jgi:hypothetical protein